MTIQPQIGEIIDNRYKITEICSNEGGMGILFFVDDQDDSHDMRLVLKCCKKTDENSISRFKRETRLLDEFRDNNKVAQMISLNPEHDPPYFVMRFYEEGDLSKIIPKLISSPENQEATFLKMCECIAELHAKDIYHRDIKPQNFLMDGESLVVSDLGLSVSTLSLTGITATTEYRGTPEYWPPEASIGGFKNADPPYDIFMLGKSFYKLLTNIDPHYLHPDNVHPAILTVIERCCRITKELRYQQIHEVQQAIVGAYDVILNRVEGLTKCKRILEDIKTKLEANKGYVGSEVDEFIDLLGRLEHDDQEMVCKELTPRMFYVLAQEPFVNRHLEILSIYSRMSQNGSYGWSFAEHIADCMSAMIDSDDSTPNIKAEALNIAMQAAVDQNRFAAMETCKRWITNEMSENDAIAIRDVLQRYPKSFVANIEPISCKNDIISSTIRSLSSISDN
ncbi:protein kinase [uncultured Gimesia sp.]|uniref:protein kinase domain-containing protein n=1 Tax=uncultured Gimesia sp. TaxID=1678688 RepID=UPI0030DAF478|tara:strand:- start:60472 stop:61824 length:1353 start_codon:yes stop_codon:yes gene_type:complete